MANVGNVKPSVAGPRTPATSLSGLSILVTRAASQAEEITNLLIERGATVIHRPMITFIEPADWRDLDTAIDTLAKNEPSHGFNWLVFTSGNAADFFLKRLETRFEDGVRLLRGKQVCAVGHATARILSSRDIAVNVTAAESTAEGTLRALVDYIGGEEKVSGLKFLIPRSTIARDFLPSALRNLGGVVDDAEAYQTVAPVMDRESTVALFEDSHVDAVVFTSPSTVTNFAAVVQREDLSDLLRDVVVACIGPTTARTAADFRLLNVVLPDEYNIPALVEALTSSLKDAPRRDHG
jgi:uroporphyrinogen III methyltransferase / synthase